MDGTVTVDHAFVQVRLCCDLLAFGLILTELFIHC